MEKLIKLPLMTNGYLWVRPEAVRLVRVTENSKAETHLIQLNDGLEYELFGGPVNTLAALGYEEK